MKTVLSRPVLYGVAAMGQPVFSRVINFLRDTSYGSTPLIKAKNTSQFFLSAESNLWEFAQGDATSGMLFETIKKRMTTKPFVTEEVISQRLANSGYSNYEEMEHDKITALILIRTAVEEVM